MPIVLKLKFQGELRRIQLSSQGELTYEQLCQDIKQVWPEVGIHTAKYLDDEGDLCTLCSATFADFMALSKENASRKILKLELVPCKDPQPASLPFDNRNLPEEGASATANDPQPASFPFDNIGLPREDANAHPCHWVEHMSKHWKDMAKHWKHFGKHWKGHQSCHGKNQHSWDEEEYLLRGDCMLWVLSQLRASGALTGKTVASLFTHLLPKIIVKIAEDIPKADDKLRRGFAKLKPRVEDLCGLVLNTPGLEHCWPALEDSLELEFASPGEAVLALLLALESLPFEAKISFVEDFYGTQEKLVNDLLDKIDANIQLWAPGAAFPMSHEGITCDGCNQQPLKGLRFKCTSLPNYDLCAECFAKRNVILSGDWADHTFHCIVVDWTHGVSALRQHGVSALRHIRKHFCGKGWGKGHTDNMKGQEHECNYQGKGKGKGKGKGECKGNGRSCVSEASCGAPQSIDMETEDSSKSKAKESHALNSSLDKCKPCKMGCGFLATWHSEVCCHRCARGEPHGPRCDRKLVCVPCKDSNSLAQSANKKPNPATRLVFPVVVGDGRQLSIEWDREEDPQQVAQRFAAAHGIEADELSTIVAFVQHANMVTRPSVAEPMAEDIADTGSKEEVVIEEQASKTAHRDEDEYVKVLVDMGLGEPESLREVLRACGNDVQKVVEYMTQ